jgi:hypothetical protein
VRCLGRAACCLLVLPVVTHAATRYEIEATLSNAAPQIHGRVRVRFTNTSERPLSSLALSLFPNRFSSEANDAGGVDDVTRPFVYPRERFVPGRLELADVSVADDTGTALLDRVVESEHPDVPAGCLVELQLLQPVPPGHAVQIEASFATTVPERFGSFGVFRKTLTALGGWHPYLVALDTNGAWLVDRYPPLATFAVHLEAAPGSELLLNGHHHDTADGALHLTLGETHYLSLVATPRFERTERTIGARPLTIYQLPERYSFRLGWGRAPRTVLIDTITELAGELAADQDETEPLVVVTAPLRYQLTRPAEGMVVLSDRAFHVNAALRPFHRARVAAAIVYERRRPAIATRESVDDYHWVAEGLGYAAGQSDRQRHAPRARDVHGWIRLFNIFAIVDRFESEPKIPFVQTFFPRTGEDDPLRAHVLTFNRQMPPGGVVFEKLRAVLGEDAYYRLVVAYAHRPGGLRTQADMVAGQPLALAWFFDSWIDAYPALDYAVASTQLNEFRDGTGLYHHRATVERRSSRPVREAVDVAFEPRWRPAAPRAATTVWNEPGERGDVEATTPHRVHRVQIDPDLRLVEDTRVDNAEPWPLQMVIDSANVTVTSTQFGLAALGVARKRYDYRKDLALLGFFNERGVGTSVGPRYHWGPQIDATGYRHNLFGYYTQIALDDDFTDDTRPGRRTDGNIGGFGMRYDYTNVLNPDNPTRARQLRLFTDWYDDSLGGDFSFVNWGAVATATHPIGSPLTILALQVMNGFTDPVDGSRLPNQGLYSLGGTRAIRGIGVEDELGKNILMLRGEIRRTVYPEIDHNLFDIITVRRGQVRLFVDSGQVDDRRNTLYRPSHFAVGVGIGFAAVYDFLGFYPAIAFIEVAGRVDEFSGVDNGPQILLGTRQTF